MLPTNIPASLSNQTVRQIARLSIGGKRARVVLSNEYGATPLVIGVAHIARAAGGSRIAAGSDHALTFGGSGAVTIAPGASAISDPVNLELAPLTQVAVSIYLPQATPLSTFHWDGKQTAYIGQGDLAAAPLIETDNTVEARLFLSAILVDTPSAAPVVTAFGDSITDGAGSTSNSNQRWPDLLAQRLVGQQVAVINAGISGARMLDDKMGVNAMARFDRDVLSQPNLDSVILLMGINDIAWPGSSLASQDPAMSVDPLIAAYRQLIARAHLRHVRIVGATLTPFKGALQDGDIKNYYSEAKEQTRQRLNQWIRSSGEFDAVIDFDAVLRDPQQPRRFLPAFDSGDHLHPGDRGYKAMADAIDLHQLLGKP
ncbi:GDSL-like Lipase/Acylhydrolase family protein [Collimonas arenae]|uniref:GDSL-like Lipase/Acylhydrolase family protein n=1 Tax=Collimonas arenae TaxID=279058 RepID=A0A127PJU6_9BURK|nr:SGNH/GDSL hydrolase family protein [Collimonas arenae]AMO98058.1 GDSL-like Lipase/Acylhydrolase family protein [Collimonas arenae]AMP07920.1 GDSL-like Lipase/Acylhydrolase family protein [Collimonas arenae]